MFEEANGTVLRPPRKAAADQQWYELAGSVPGNRIITGLFGVFPSLDFNKTSTGMATAADGGASHAHDDAPADGVDAGADGELEVSLVLRDAGVPRGFNGSLSGLRIRGELYTVTSGLTGLALSKDQE